MFQHAVDSMEQFPHNRTKRLHFFFAVIHHQVLEISPDVRVMLMGAQSRHIKGCSDITVTGFGYPRLLVDAFARVEGPGVEPGKIYPFPMGQAGWQQ